MSLCYPFECISWLLRPNCILSCILKYKDTAFASLSHTRSIQTGSLVSRLNVLSPCNRNLDIRYQPSSSPISWNLVWKRMLIRMFKFTKPKIYRRNHYLHWSIPMFLQYPQYHRPKLVASLRIDRSPLVYLPGKLEPNPFKKEIFT